MNEPNKNVIKSVQNRIEDLDTNPEIIENFDLLKRTGVLDHINQLNVEIHNLEVLFKEAWEITGKTSIDNILDYVVSKLLEKFVPSYFALVLQEPARAKFLTVRCYRNMRPYEQCLNMTTLDPFREFFLQYSNPISYELLAYKLGNAPAVKALEVLEPEIIVPIVGFLGLYGLIVIGKKFVGNEYTMEEISYLDRLMKFTSISIQNNIHHQNAITDQKTGVKNHSFFMERMEEELARIKRHQTQFALFMIDIDKFKKFNDTYGHLLGDEVLVRISDILTTMTRREDVVSRFGGEEFSILMTDISKQAAWNIAERIRQETEGTVIEHKGKQLSITISLGIRHVSLYSYAPAQTLIEEADTALYRSKSNGRNLTSVHNPGLLFRAQSMGRRRTD
jgi:diguanylate cyclase (GGDEF)-like protein